MKKRIVVFIAALMALMFTLGFSAHTVSAEESSPSVSIEKFNLAFENDTHLKYAVKFIGIDDSEINYNNIGMLYWTDYDGGFTPGTENYSSKTTGYTMIDEEKYYAFEYDNLAAKQLTDYVYSIAYLEYNGETYYSEPVKYSALEYAYNRLGKTHEGTTDTELIAILNNMLTYGASAQQYFDYKEDRLATDDFYQITVVGGSLSDGFCKGLYLSTYEVTITAPPELDGKTFTTWQNFIGETVSDDNPAIITNFTANETYTAIYTETKNYSEGLEFTSNGDGTCYVSGMGTFDDIILLIPPKSPNGEKVINIGSFAFADSNIISITLPSTVENIENYAFQNCYKLIEVINKSSLNIVAGEYNGNGMIAANAFEVHNKKSKITNSNDFLFYDYNNNVYLVEYVGNLEKITLPESYDSYEILPYAFYKKYHLVEVILPNNVVKIGKNAFEDCENLISITIPDTITTIEYKTFSNCKSLANIKIPEKVTCIGDNSFAECKKLTSIIIPDNVLTIGNYAFEGCNSLYSVTIGTSVTKIGYNAFIGSNLTTAFFRDVTTWYYQYYLNSSESIQINCADLQSTWTAAMFLKTNYNSYYWIKI